LNDDSVSVINNPETPLEGASLKVKVIGLDAVTLSDSTIPVKVAANSAARVANVGWADFAVHPVQFLKLELVDRGGKLLSENFYWHSKTPEQLQSLGELPQVALTGAVQIREENGETVATVDLRNPTPTVALMTHLTLRDAKTRTRILPAYASDNYVSLLPGESKTVTICCPTKNAPPAIAVSLDGWNIAPTVLVD